MAKATDAAEKKAAEQGVNIESVEGSGQGGKVTVEDVEQAEFVAVLNPRLPIYARKTGDGRSFYKDPGENPLDDQMVTQEQFDEYSKAADEDGEPYIVKGVG